jgi:hypothetical protein
MKTFILHVLLIIVLSFSCRKPENVPTPSSVISGKKWKLIYYSLNGTDITKKFSNCSLSFGKDGVMIIKNADKEYTGTWKEISDPPKLEMDVSTNDQFVALFSRTWENKLLNPARIELADLKIQPQEIIKLDVIP